MSLKGKLLKFGLPLVILMVGFAGMLAMVQSKSAPKRKAKEVSGYLVEVIKAEIENHPVIITGTGEVNVRQESSVTPQVSGRVTYLATDFVAGGVFSEGDLLFSVEDVDYLLAIEQAKASLAKAEYDLSTVEAQARVAREEWERLKGDKDGDPNPLVLYKPQLANARASMESARAALSRANIDLKRTRILAPFNCRVRSEDIDMGQYVRSGTSVGIIAGTDEAEVYVPLPMEEMKWLEIPRRKGDGRGSIARVILRGSGSQTTFEGRIDRSLGEVDPRSRMARVVVSVQDPYHLSDGSKNGTQSLETGMFVTVEMKGKELRKMVSIPRNALRDGDTIWTVSDGNTLHIRPVKVVRLERDRAYIDGGTWDGESIVISNISGAAEGMNLRISMEDKTL